jgi:hypothetical protein
MVRRIKRRTYSTYSILGISCFISSLGILKALAEIPIDSSLSLSFNQAENEQYVALVVEDF